MPEFWPKYDTSFMNEIKKGGKNVVWTTGAYVLYLDHLLSKEPLSKVELTALNKKHNFDDSANPELIFKWSMLGIKGKRPKSV